MNWTRHLPFKLPNKELTEMSVNWMLVLPLFLNSKSQIPKNKEITNPKIQMVKMD